MNNDKATGGLVAVIGKKEDLQTALSAALAGAAVFSGEIPFYPGLRIRDNAQQLRMMLPEGKKERFEALLKLSELKKDGWTHPFRKTDSEAVRAKLAEAGTQEQADALTKRMEAGETW